VFEIGCWGIKVGSSSFHVYVFWGEERRLKVFENRVLRKIFRLKRDEETGEWNKLHIEELNDLYSTPNIIRVIKSRILRGAGYVAGMGERRNVYRVFVWKSDGKNNLEDPGLNGRIILQRIFRKWDGGHGLEWSGSE